MTSSNLKCQKPRKGSLANICQIICALSDNSGFKWKIIDVLFSDILISLFHSSTVFIYIHFDWICCNRTWGSVYVCLSVCLCTSMCVWSLQPKRTKRFWWFYKWSDRYLPVTFFVVFQSSNLMTSWWPFCIFALRHSHGRNFGPIFFKFGHKVLWCMPMFAIENQQDRSVTSGDRKNRILQKNLIFGAKIEIFEIG